MERLTGNEKGSALVVAVFFLLGLAVTGLIIAGVATSERRVAHNEYTHTRAVNSADAGGEVGINWIRMMRQNQPLPDNNTRMVDIQDFQHITERDRDGEDNRFRYEVTFDRPAYDPRYDARVFRFGRFTVEAEGEAAEDDESVIDVEATRMFIKGY